MAGRTKKPDKPDELGYEPEDESAVATEEEEKVDEPRLYHVLIHNDDYTTMEFVVLVLTSIFHMPHETAVQVMLNVHQKGIGVAGTYSYEVAESKAEKAMKLAREHEFPLRTTVEPV
jgi:ATP-dependent Clp protease adaptor protein ClpS